MISGASVNVLDFGADPTNTVDSSLAIQAAIDSITEGTVIFPAGDYRIENEITIQKNNIELIGLSTATLVVPTSATMTTGVVLNIYDNTGSQPVNIQLQNINIDVDTASGSGGIRWGAKYSSMKNVNVRIRGDNMSGVYLVADDAGSGPYYCVLEQVFVQGDSSSGTPLTGTNGFNFVSSTATPSRNPNADTFIRCRVGGCYTAYSIKGHGHSFVSCTSEGIDGYHYYCGHPSSPSGASYNVISNPYCEQRNTSTVFYCNTNASGNLMINPYYTGVATVFTDDSTNQNNRLIDPNDIPVAGTPVTVAAAHVTGTTINRGFNADSVSKIGTGTFRLTFTDALDNVNYFVSCVAASNDVTVRVSVYNTGYVQLYFFDAAGAATDPTGFSVICQL